MTIVLKAIDLQKIVEELPKNAQSVMAEMFIANLFLIAKLFVWNSIG